MARRMVPRNRGTRRGAEEENFGERFGNNYGYGREGERVEEIGPAANESDYVDRYGPSQPMYSEEVRGSFRGMGPRGYQRSDERIRDEIYERLTRHGGLDARDIDFQVQDGEVTLSGRVNNRQAKHMAEELVYGVLGVKDVHNELRLR
jgi:hypothetical protein